MLNKPTLKDLAQELGLSVSVVSRVLNGKASDFRISEQTQLKVRKTATRLGFSVNQVARGLRLQKSQTIGLIIPDISNSFFSTIARSVENLARRKGYSTILCDTENDAHVEKDALNLLHDRAVDGFLVAPVGSDPAPIQAIADMGVPLVLVDRFFETLDIPYVTSNNFQGAYAGTIHLINEGHRRIGFIQGIPDSKPNLERLRGFKTALEEQGIPVEASLLAGSRFDEEDGYHSAMSLLQQSCPPTALLATSSLGALGVMRACLTLGRSIPADISLIGFDEYPYARLLAPPLTTIAQETQAIAEVASNLLLDWLDNGTRPVSTATILDAVLVHRASVARFQG